MSVCSGHCCCCKVAPSLLACDLANLASEAKSVLNAGADWLHLDVFDGHFVPNITWGMPVLASLKKHTPDAFFDCHMCVAKPSQWVKPIAESGGSQYTFHIEAVETDELDIPAICKLIKSAGMRVGIAMKPETGMEAVAPYVDLVDMVLVMTVEPGFGGQSFMPNMMPKVLQLRTQFPQLEIQVDGGLSPKTVDAAAKAGANVIVAGSAVFKPGLDPAEPIAIIRRSVEKYGNQKDDESLTPLPAPPSSIPWNNIRTALAIVIPVLYMTLRDKLAKK